MDDLGLDGVVCGKMPLRVVVEGEGGDDRPAAGVALGFLIVTPKHPAFHEKIYILYVATATSRYVFHLKRSTPHEGHTTLPWPSCVSLL